MAAGDYGGLGGPPSAGSGGGGGRGKKGKKGGRVALGSTVDRKGQVIHENAPAGYRGVSGQIEAAGGNPAAAYAPGAMVPGPRYFTGDEFSQLPGNEQDRLALQEAMIQGGLMDRSELGIWGPKSQKAFTQLLASSNSAGAEWIDVLSTKIAAKGTYDAAQEAAKRQAQIPALQIKLSNPDDLKAVAQKVAQTLYGGDLPDGDLNRFVGAYQGMERDLQTKQHNDLYGNYVATGQLGNTEETAQADPSVAAEKQIRAEHPGQVMVTELGNALGNVVNAFTQSVVPGR